MALCMLKFFFFSICFFGFVLVLVALVEELSDQLHGKRIACVSRIRGIDCFAVDHMLRIALQFKKLSLLAVAFSLSECGG